MALAACSGTQNGPTPNTVPAIGAQQTASTTGRSTTGLILVANEGGGEAGSIREYTETANGNVAPNTVISNHNGGPVAIAISTSQGIGIANGTLNSENLPGAETFALNATGNAPALTAITCFPKPSQTDSVAFDSAGNLYVAWANGDTKAIDVFAPGATGCVKRNNVIADGGGLAIDSKSVLYVANKMTGTIDIFAPGSRKLKAQIGGRNTGLVAPVGVTLDAARNAYVFDAQAEAISEFAAGVHGNVAPIRTISGLNTGLSGAGLWGVLGLAISKTSGEIFISNPTSNTILGFAANAIGNSAPIQTIAGGSTGLSVPLGIAIEE